MTFTLRNADGGDIMIAITLWNVAQMYYILEKNNNTEWGKKHRYVYMGFCGVAYIFSLGRALGFSFTL
jgi:hypothetical protein